MNAPSRLNLRSHAGRVFGNARDSVLHYDGADTEQVCASFEWPQLTHFNWALDWFDSLSWRHEPALILVKGEQDWSVSYAELSRRSNQVANWLHALGAQRGERIMIMLPNSIELYALLLGAMKLGLLIIPGYPSLTGDNLHDRLTRSRASHVVAIDSVTGNIPRLDSVQHYISVGAAPEGWSNFSDHEAHPENFQPQVPTAVDEPLFGYFTSGTTSAPKLVLHTHQSYPIGHLSSVYWNGIRPMDIHLNISAPGWAKHSWSSFFVPWSCEATIVSLQEAEVQPATILATLKRLSVTTFCAPPTVWRALLRHGIGSRPDKLREIVSAGEPLDATLIEAVLNHWGLALRNGFGQSEATAIVGFAPGTAIKPGALGYPLPGYPLELLDLETRLPADEGEICLPLLKNRTRGLMLGYDADPQRTEKALGGSHYLTGDIARRDSDGCLWYLGRTDDQFKSFDYRISPVELESVLLQHPGIAQAAVVPLPDPIGLFVPKAFVVLRPGYTPGAAWADDVFKLLSRKLPPELRVCRLSVIDEMPKTLSGKIMRSTLRQSPPVSRAEFNADSYPQPPDAIAEGARPSSEMNTAATEQGVWPRLMVGDLDGVMRSLPLRLQKMHNPDRAGIWSQTLYRTEPDGAVAALVRYEAGARAKAHLHNSSELIYVLDGELQTGEQTHPKGSLLILAPGSRHAPFSEKGASLLVIWESPVTPIDADTEISV